VKRLLPYVILALAFHAFILSTDFGWLKLAPRPKPALKSLSITLSADKLQKRKAQAAVPNKAPKRQFEPSFNQKPRQNPAAMPAPARLEDRAQPQKPPPAAPPKNIVKKTRQKKNLKALTHKKQHIKTIEATLAATGNKRQIALKAEAKISSPASSGNRPFRQVLPADTVFIKKTHHVPDGSSEPTTTAVILPATQSDDTLSGPVLNIARPLYKQNTSPPYPRKARRLGYEGIVMLKVLIDENGRVDDLAVLESSGHSVLDRAALSAVRKWLFEPGTEGGIKKKMWVKIPVRFDLK
jgi:TonB family protein